MNSCEIDFNGDKFNSSFTFDSGQVFRWRQATNHEWIGIVSGHVIKVENQSAVLLGRTENHEDFSELVTKYFSLDDNFVDIVSTFPRGDTFLQSSLDRFEGLRLLTQESWECLISFVCSIDCNIPSIKLKIENLSKKFGHSIYTGLDEKFYSFPSPLPLSRADKGDLLACKLGFRWKFVKFIARQVVRGKLDLESIRQKSYLEAASELVSEVSGKTFGVGPKVADCEMLYSFHKKEAFPLDVWLMKYVQQIYGENLKMEGGLSRKKYYEIAEHMRKKFGQNAGYAQLFLYEMIRRGGLIQSTEPA